MYRNLLQLSYPNSMHDYDVFPRVVPAGKESTIAVKPLGKNLVFTQGKAYQFRICPTDEGTPKNYLERPNNFQFSVTPDADGCCRFTFHFFSEQEYFLRMYDGDQQLPQQLNIYAVEEDLVGRYPFRGDLHMHTCRSDGHQAPAIVAANYRKTGYDFLGITDHGRYFGSLEAIEDYKDAPIEFVLIPGEEVHMPKDFEGRHINDIHIVNFGGEYGINDLVTPHPNSLDGRSNAGQNPEKPRAVIENPPPIRTKEEHWAEIEAYAKTLDLPADMNPSEQYTYASCHWIFREIKKAGGLGIYAHPFWLADVYQVPLTFHDYMIETHPFGAYEVLGGERYYEQNGFQVAHYYADVAKGRRYPVVGSTDSHCSVNHIGSHTCCTIVFSPENERRALIDSIEQFYSVPVDTVDETPRYIGDFRMVRYANFLERCYFPIHDELCFEEGRAMKDYVNNLPGAKEILAQTNGRVKAYQKHVFAW